MEVSKASCSRFDALDFRVQPFRDRVGDAVLQIVQQVLKMALEHLGHVDHRIHTASAYPAIPILEKPPSPAFLLIFPELGEQLLGGPGPRHFQVQVLQFGKLRGLFLAKILRIIQPQLPTALRLPLPQSPSGSAGCRPTRNKIRVPDPMEKEWAVRCGHRAYRNRDFCRPGSLTRRIGLIDFPRPFDLHAWNQKS